MDWMNLKPGWLLFLATTFVGSCALWTGILFSVSWLTGRARLMADGPEVGSLALTLHRRWATPLLLVSLLDGFACLAGGPIDRLQAHWVYGIALALLAITGLHVAVASRAKRVVRGSVRATQGEGFRRAALLVSFGAIVAFAALRTSILP
jgi:hypothetical protein